MKASLALSVFVTAAVFSGCAHYDFYLVEPGQNAQRITKQTIRVSYPPLDYRMAEVEGRLALNIDNPTTTPVNLLGHRSSVVDPRGVSRPLPQRLIAPHSFIPMLLPPRPLMYRVYNPYPFYRPWYGGGWPYYYPWYDPFFYEPLPYTYTYEIRTPYNWDWKEGQVRANFVYEQGGQTIEHHFVFDRRREK